MVLAGLLADDKLLESRERTERVDDDFPRIRVCTEVKLAFGDVSRVVRYGMGDVSVVEGSHGYDGD